MKKLFMFFLFFVSFSLFAMPKIHVGVNKIFSLALPGRAWIYSKNEKDVNLIKISDYDDLQVFTFSIAKLGDFNLHFVENNSFKESRNSKDFLLSVGDLGDPNKDIKGINVSLNIKNTVKRVPSKLSKKDEMLLAEKSFIKKTELKIAKSIPKKISPKVILKKVIYKARVKKAKPKPILKEIKTLSDEEKIAPIEEVGFKVLNKNEEETNKTKTSLKKKNENLVLDDWFINGISKKLSQDIKEKIEMIIKDTKEKETIDQMHSMAVYKKLITNYPFYNKLDEVYFRLAKLYEKDGSSQNLVKAKDMYQAIVEKFSLSLHFKEALKKVNYFKQFYNL